MRINKSRGLAERAFKLELGNNEGINDMKRQFETQINIKPVSYQLGYESDDMSDNDIDSIQDTVKKLFMKKEFLKHRLLQKIFMLLYFRYFSTAIKSDLYESALEQVERNFNDFDAAKIDVHASHKNDSMEFEKKAFFYWLDDGVVEIAVEMEAGNAGTWRTIDNDLSAKGIKRILSEINLILC